MAKELLLEEQKLAKELVLDKKHLANKLVLEAQKLAKDHWSTPRQLRPSSEKKRSLLVFVPGMMSMSMMAMMVIKVRMMNTKTGSETRAELAQCVI